MNDSGSEPTVLGLILVDLKTIRVTLQSMDARLRALEQREFARTRLEKAAHALITAAIGMAGIVAGWFLTKGN